MLNPLVLQYEPGAHGSAADMAASGQNVAIGHAVATVEPAGEYAPAATALAYRVVEPAAHV